MADERTEASGDVLQDTTHGVLVKRAVDARVAFTDGFLTWMNGPDGMEARLNTERFPWEDTTASPGVSPANQNSTTPAASSPPAVKSTVPVATTSSAPSPSVPATAAPPATDTAAVTSTLPVGDSTARDPGKVESAAVATTFPPGQLSARMSILSNSDIGDGFNLGGLSGLASVDRSGTSFISVTDRGPNQDVRVRGSKASAFLYPTFVPSIVRLERAGDTLRVVEKTPLKMPKGRSPVTGGNGSVACLSAHGKSQLTMLTVSAYWEPIPTASILRALPLILATNRTGSARSTAPAFCTLIPRG